MNISTNKISYQFILLLLTSSLVLSTVSCGFKLRQAASLPANFGPVQIQGIGKLSAFYKSVRNALRQNSIDITDDGSANHTIVISNYRRDRKVLSVGADGKVSEYELISSASYQVLDSSGQSLYPSENFSVSRYYTVSTNETLSDDLEEADLYERMEQSLVNQIFRHIAANVN
jgi:LPS-assembly lipoprotein